MDKYILLVRGHRTEPYADFRQRVFDLGTTIGLRHSPRALRITLTAYPPPAISIIPFRKDRIAALSVTGPEGDMAGSLADIPGFSGLYAVEEAIPVAYEKTWDDGLQTPGACLLTLFTKKRGIDFDSFLDRWHNGHTPLSLKLHPLWNYNRNVVREKLTDQSQAWDGIVEEHFRTPADLLNPFRFFGPPLKIGWNMWQVFADTRSFLDYKTIETYLVVEYHLKSPRG